MRIHGQVAFALGLFGALGSACGEDAGVRSVLVVQAAQEQPGLDELGVIVVVQSLGGKWLEFEVSGGTLEKGKTEACLRAPSAGSLRENRLNVLVFPAGGEAVVTVRLLPDAPRVEDVAAGDAGASLGAPELGPCRIDAAWLHQVIKPVQRVTPVPPPAGGGAAGAAGTAGSAGSGGVGGVSGQGGAGGASGTGGASGETSGGAGGSPEGGSSGETGSAGRGEGGKGGEPGNGGDAGAEDSAGTSGVLETGGSS